MNEPKPRLVLTTEDKLSPVWKKLCIHWEDRLESFRTQNEGDKSEVETAKLRGRIAECRANLALSKDPIQN